MDVFRTNIKAWLRTQEDVVAGRPFPYGEFSCVPLSSRDVASDPSPVGFLLSKGDSIALVEPTAENTLWEHLVAEMTHWHTHPGAEQELPAECWYG